MDPTFLRKFWSLVEDAQATLLLQLDDVSLSSWLLSQIEQEMELEDIQQHSASHYVQSRLPLVRDLAQARLGGF